MSEDVPFFSFLRVLFLHVLKAQFYDPGDLSRHGKVALRSRVMLVEFDGRVEAVVLVKLL